MKISKSTSDSKICPPACPANKGNESRFYFRNTFLRGGTVVLERAGLIVSRMEFKQGERSSSFYETPWGTMEVDIVTTKLAHRFTERVGDVHLLHRSRSLLSQKQRGQTLKIHRTMEVDIVTTKLAHRFTERGGVMEIAFTIAVNHQVTGENRFKVRPGPDGYVPGELSGGDRRLIGPLGQFKDLVLGVLDHVDHFFTHPL